MASSAFCNRLINTCSVSASSSHSMTQSGNCNCNAICIRFSSARCSATQLWMIATRSQRCSVACTGWLSCLNAAIKADRCWPRRLMVVRASAKSCCCSGVTVLPGGGSNARQLWASDAIGVTELAISWVSTRVIC